MSRTIRGLALAILMSASGSGFSQTPLLHGGDAVVTGFSGTVAAGLPKSHPPGKSATDFTFIDADGPAARILNIGQPNAPADGRLFAAPKTFDIPARDVGQVFGVALDDQPAPNIYLSATSAFGLNLVARNREGHTERRKVGGPGVGWMKGQFGLDLQGDPGSIYRIDGTTGVASLFARVMLNGVPNPAPGLGALAYDAAHKQLFVSDLYTGMIHRFATADGREGGAPFDHGTTGRGAAGLPPVAFDPAKRPGIESNHFNANDPHTWGFAPPERRVWALAVRDGRLFYSANNGSTGSAAQIWSVGIAQDGGLASDARIEIEIPAPSGTYPVSDIAFAPDGAMIVAQRAPMAASYDYSAFTAPGEPAVLRFSRKTPSDPPSPGLWKPVPDEYPVGFAGDSRNSNGGVSLAYGYGPDNTIAGGSCGGALLFTGDHLRLNPGLRERLAPGGPLPVDGVQISPFGAVLSPSLAQPWSSYFVDYDGKLDASAPGHMGSVRSFMPQCPAAAGAGLASGAASPAYVSGPPGSGGSAGGGGGYPPPPPPPIGSGDLVVVKKLVNETGGALPPGLSFPVNVACTGRPNDPLTLVDGVPQTVTNLPFGTQCVVTEAPPPPPAGLCRQEGGGVPSWQTAIVPPGATIVPGTTTTIVVTNTLKCDRREKTGEVSVTKKVANKTEANLTGLTYPVTVSCTGQPPRSLTLVDGVTQTIGNIPLPSTCSATEGALPPAPARACPQGQVATWLPPSVSPASVPAGTPAPTITVVNTLVCEDMRKPVDLRIEKTGGTSPAPAMRDYVFTLKVTNVGAAFTGTNVITVNDVVPAGMTFNGATGAPDWSCNAPPPIGSGGTLTCTYIGAGPTSSGQVLSPISIAAIANGSAPFPPFTNCATVGLTPASGLTDANPADNKSCVTVTKPGQACTPPLVMNAAGECVCPSGSHMEGGKCVSDKTCVAPMTPNAAGECVCPPPATAGAVPGQCICRNGRVMTAAGVCDGPPPPICTPPLVPNAAGVCACPPGTQLSGKECVKITTDCKPPLVPNAAGVCSCPAGRVLRNGRCIAVPVCKPPMVATAEGRCVCPQGTIRRGGRCVPVPTCNPPAVLKGGVCRCPAGTVASRNFCIVRRREPKREPVEHRTPQREHPVIVPGDVIREIPGFIPRGGGGHGGFPGGGGGFPGGGGAGPRGGGKM